MVEYTESRLPQSSPSEHEMLTKTFSSSNDIHLSKHFESSSDIQLSNTFESSNDIDNRTVFEEKKYLIQTYLVIATLLATLNKETPFFVYIFFIIGILFYTALITNTFFDRDTTKKRTVLEKIGSHITILRRDLKKDKSIVNSFALSVGIMFGILVGGSIHIQNNCFFPSFLIRFIGFISCLILMFLCILTLWI